MDVGFKGLGKPNSGLKLGSRPSWNEAGHGIGNRTSDIEIGNRPYLAYSTAYIR